MAGRYEGTQRVISELVKPVPFVGAEVTQITDFREFLDGIRDSRDPPNIQTTKLYNIAQNATDWRHKIYNCLVLYDSEAFGRLSPYTAHGWGLILKTKQDPILGIILFELDPRKILEFAKAMKAKGRAYPIFDLYGRVVFP